MPRPEITTSYTTRDAPDIIWDAADFTWDETSLTWDGTNDRTVYDTRSTITTTYS